MNVEVLAQRSTFIPSRLIGRGLKMAGGSGLPGNCRFPRLFDQAAQAGFGRPDQLGFTALEKGGEQDIEFTILS